MVVEVIKGVSRRCSERGEGMTAKDNVIGACATSPNFDNVDNDKVLGRKTRGLWTAKQLGVGQWLAKYQCMKA